MNKVDTLKPDDMDGMRDQVDQLRQQLAALKPESTDLTPLMGAPSVGEQRVAYELAVRWHEHQVDKAGRPYIEHLCAVRDLAVRLFPSLSPAGRCAALLHDVIEDTEATPTGLLEAGMSQRTVELVGRLTYGPTARGRWPDYLDWIRSIAAAGDVEAMVIKLADNLHNSDLTRVASGSGDMVAMSAATARAKTRYAPAREILLQGLRGALSQEA